MLLEKEIVFLKKLIMSQCEDEKIISEEEIGTDSFLLKKLQKREIVFLKKLIMLKCEDESMTSEEEIETAIFLLKKFHLEEEAEEAEKEEPNVYWKKLVHKINNTLMHKVKTRNFAVIQAVATLLDIKYNNIK